MFQIDKDHLPSVGPISQRYKWCCNNGCGECTPVLVEFRTYHSTLNGATDQERTQYRILRASAVQALRKALATAPAPAAQADSVLEDAARARGIKIAEAAKEVECPNCSLRVISNCGSRHGCPMPDIYAAARKQGGV